MRMDFPKKSNVFVQKQKCGISNDVFSYGSGTAEIQVTDATSGVGLQKRYAKIRRS